jgi:hypothetical protein
LNIDLEVSDGMLVMSQTCLKTLLMIVLNLRLIDIRQKRRFEIECILQCTIIWLRAQLIEGAAHGPQPRRDAAESERLHGENRGNKDQGA